jgi:alcohol dehydrogenase class IV
VALAHALEYPIGERYKCAHGAGNGIVLPEVMRYLAPKGTYEKFKITIFSNNSNPN